MGYKVFGVKVEKGTENQIQYSTKASAKLTFSSSRRSRRGLRRLGQWPVEVFKSIVHTETDIVFEPSESPLRKPEGSQQSM